MTTNVLNTTNMMEFENTLKPVRGKKNAGWLGTLKAFWAFVKVFHSVKCLQAAALREMAAVFNMSECAECGHRVSCAKQYVNFGREIADIFHRLSEELFFTPKRKELRVWSETWENAVDEILLRSDPKIYEAYLKAIEGIDDPEDVEDIRASYAAKKDIEFFGTTPFEEVKEEHRVH